MTTVERHSTRPIPHAVLKVQFKRLVSKHNQTGVILTRDLLMFLSEYEQEQGVTLLTPEQKTTLQPYCFANPELEMTADDILNLLKVMFPTANAEEILAARPRTSAPLSTRYRRPSLFLDPGADLVDLDPTKEDISNDISMTEGNSGHSVEAMVLASPTTVIDKISDEDDDQINVAQYYRRSLQVTRRLKESERSVASMTRDNEDRILQLQNRVDEMTQEVAKQKREILEYKSKEENSLDQISALEEHIDRIQRSETDQKQIYMSIKHLFDEKCREAQKLQDMLRYKEIELQKTEALLSAIHHEFGQLNEERNRLIELQKSLDQELSTSHHTHMQLEEQRNENERLKEIIDGLKMNLESRDDLSTEDAIVPEFIKAPSPTHTLHTELESQFEDTRLETEERLRTVENEKDYYKSQAIEAMEDLDRVKQELVQLKRELDLENESLVSELAQLTSIKNIEVEELASRAVKLVEEPFMIQMHSRRATADTAIDMSDLWTQSRMRQRKIDKGKRRGFQSLVGSTTHVPSSPITAAAVAPSSNMHALSRSNDRAVTNTATFAIYTLLVYIFGIVTSTFLLENGHSAGWEQALVAVASQQGGSKSKILEIILYWIEKLLEGNIPLS